MVNYVKNPGFEEVDRSMWEISYAGENDPTDYQEKADDAHDGDTLTIGVRMKCNANSWGTIDDFTLNRISD